jgi:hypothetical protein
MPISTCMRRFCLEWRHVPRIEITPFGTKADSSWPPLLIGSHPALCKPNEEAAQARLSFGQDAPFYDHLLFP